MKLPSYHSAMIEWRKIPGYAAMLVFGRAFIPKRPGRSIALEDLVQRYPDKFPPGDGAGLS